MTTPPHPPQLEFYPSYCFATASPTYNVWAKLTAADVHALSEQEEFVAQNIYFYLNHPIRWICVTGVVVAVDEFEWRTILWVDDGSGCPRGVIEVVWERPKEVLSSGTTACAPTTTITPDISGIDIGTVVRAKGTITTFRNTRQILLKRVEVLRDTESEIKAWKGITKFRTEVLMRPWVLSEVEARELWVNACGDGGGGGGGRGTEDKDTKRAKKRERRRRVEDEPPDGGREARRKERKEQKRRRKEELPSREQRNKKAEQHAAEPTGGEKYKHKTKKHHHRHGTLDALGL